MPPQLGRSNGGGAPEWGIPSTDSDATACSQSQLAHLDKLLMYSHYIVFQVGPRVQWPHVPG